MLSHVLFVFYTSLILSAGVQELPLDVAHIPDSLYTNAHAVVRYERTTCNVVALDKMFVSKEKAITILDEKGLSAGVISIPYTDKVEKIKDLKIEIYNSKGELIKEVKKKEINDLSVFDGFSIANDARRKYYEFTTNAFPFTVAYEYIEESKNTLLIPSWYPQTRTGVSVQSNTYTIQSSLPEFKLLSRKRNIDKPSIVVNEAEHKYSATHLKAIKNESKSPYYKAYFPMVRFVPTQFTYHNVEGKFTDWKSYGQWIYDHMLKDRGNLPPDVIQEVDALIPAGSSSEEIAQIVYDYVTETTRYVSVQLGIGGFKPFSPSEVYALKYGDCKALSFYTANILDHYGIEAIYTEIMSQRQYAVDYDSELPGVGQGNHIVLCLPNSGDTTWLECTSRSTFFGYAHTGIDNRQALMITPEGGKLIRTTHYSTNDNLAEKNVKISFNSDHSVKVDFQNKYHNQRHERRAYLLNEKASKREELLRDHYYDHLPKYELLEYEINANNEEKYIEEKASLHVENLIEKAGYYVILPYVVTQIYKPTLLEKERKNEIYIKSGRSDKIQVEIEIPEGYQVVEKEKELDFQNEFGSIKVHKENTSKRITILIEIKYNSGTFGSEKVEDYNMFSEKLGNVLSDKAILKPI